MRTVQSDGHRPRCRTRPGTGATARLAPLVGLAAAARARATASGWSAPGASARTSPSSVSDGPRASSAMRRASSGRPEVGQRVRHGVGDFDLRLVGRDLVDDVAIGGGERARASGSAAGRRRRSRPPPASRRGVAAGAHQILLRRADLGRRPRRPGRSPGRCSSSSSDELLVDRHVQRADRGHAEQRDAEDQRQIRTTMPATTRLRRLRSGLTGPPRPSVAGCRPRPRPGAPGRCRRSGWGRRRPRRRRRCRSLPRTAGVGDPDPGQRPADRFAPLDPTRAMTSRSR